MTRLIFITVLILCINLSSFGQSKWKDKFELNGYVANMQSVMIDSLDGNWINDNTLHNRLNFKFYATDKLTFSTEARTRIFTGESVKYNPSYADMYEKDKGIFDMSWVWVSEPSVIVNSMVDRLWVNYETGKFNIRAGRQRINWGRSFVWNPNNIFNSYSFFDFDYPERPGSDAFRVQYYPTSSSNIDLAASIDSTEKVTAGLRYMFNKFGYDIQTIAGLIKEEELILGIGWEGYIKAISFRGEVSWLYPFENSVYDEQALISSISLDYTFENSLMIQAEFLYNKDAKINLSGGFQSLYYSPESVRSLSFTEYNFFVGVNYPATPLLNISLSGMYYPDFEGWFVGPSFTFSLSDNSELAFFVQNFSGKFENPYTQTKDRIYFTLGFLRLKISF